jgi:glycosyltransferase involved in cell wall biosynthesis
LNILFLCQLIPYPADAGPKVRAYYTLRYLAERHAVTLLAFRRPEDGEAGLEHLREFCSAVHTVTLRRSRWRDVQALLSAMTLGQSFVIRRDLVDEMQQLMAELLAGGEFDAVHADQLWMAQYALQADDLNQGSFRGRPVRLVLDEHNACFQIVERLAAGEANSFKKQLLKREVFALRNFEARAIRRFDVVTTVTEEDRATLQLLAVNGSKDSLSERPAFYSIPICVDTSEVQPVMPSQNSKDVLHLGTMFFPPNVEGVLWFAHQVWPHIRSQVPQATFTIAGKNPPREVLQLTEGKGVQGGIRVTGYVTDPKPYLEQAGAFIVPLFAGSGMRVKILEAWRWGLPVVATSIGAEGIDYRDGEDILIADRAEDLAAAVGRVLQEPELSEALRRNGRRRVEQEYDWRQVYPAWEAIYGE